MAYPENVEIPQRKGNMDLILYLCGIAIFMVGFIMGRFERRDSYTKTYKYGFEIGKRVGARDASK